jgi:teichuronic acid biosynthesis glycosyltransferase TuaG
MADDITTNYSVVIPTWNRARMLPRAIYSVLCQTVAPFEVLVCDDGSDDESEDIVRQFGDPVKWCPGERGGRPAIPRNRGIRESAGEWIAFLDSDDEWLPQKMEKQFAGLRKTGCEASCTNAYRYVPATKSMSILLPARKQPISFTDLLDVNLVICSSVVLRRSLLEKATGFPEDKTLTALEDYSLWLRIASQTPFAFVNEPLVTYLDEPESSVRKENADPSMHKKVVFGNFREWAEAHGMSSQINQMKRNGNGSGRVQGFAGWLSFVESFFSNRKTP